MAVAIMGGLLVATVLTLLFLPALYAAWFKVKPPRFWRDHSVMRFWKHTVLAAALTGLALPAFAVDLLETWQAARAYDSAYAAAFAAAQAGQEKAPKPVPPLLPQLALSGDYTRGFPEKPLLQPRFRTGNAGAQLTRTLFDWSKFAVLEKGKQAALIATDQLAARRTKI